MLSYKATRVGMRILELENRCTGNRTVGSNPTLSVLTLLHKGLRVIYVSGLHSGLQGRQESQDGGPGRCSSGEQPAHFTNQA